MDTSRFDALTRALSNPSSRRSLVAAAAGIVAGALGLPAPVSARCKRVGQRCKRNSDCCQGARCKGGKCRCAGGRNVCGQACCTQCFAEATSETTPPIPGTEFCCAAASVCDRGTGDPADDLCCWPDEACIDGECCCDGCEGSVVCGGVCCPSVSCCNGACCGPNQVCATQGGGGLACVSANRSCPPSSNCFAGETCRGGVCCSGDRICADINGPTCCPLGKHCDPDSGFCCDNGVTCGTTQKKVRIRP